MIAQKEAGANDRSCAFFLSLGREKRLEREECRNLHASGKKDRKVFRFRRKEEKRSGVCLLSKKKKGGEKKNRSTPASLGRGEEKYREDRVLETRASFDPLTEKRRG